jgi:hypothetical protein
MDGVEQQIAIRGCNCDYGDILGDKSPAQRTATIVASMNRRIRDGGTTAVVPIGGYSQTEPNL